MKIILKQDVSGWDVWTVLIKTRLWSSIYVWNKDNKAKNAKLVTCSNLRLVNADAAAIAAAEQYGIKVSKIQKQSTPPPNEDSIWHTMHPIGKRRKRSA